MMKIVTVFFGYSKYYNYMGKHLAFGDFAKATSKMNCWTLGLCFALNLYQIAETIRNEDPIKRAKERGFALK